MPRRKTEGGAFKLLGKTFFRSNSPEQFKGKEQAFVDYVNTNRPKEQYDSGTFIYNNSNNKVTANGVFFKNLNKTYTFPEFVEYAKTLGISTEAFLESSATIPLPLQSSETPQNSSDLTSSSERPDPIIGINSSPEKVTTEALDNKSRFFKNLQIAKKVYPSETSTIVSILFDNINRNEAFTITPEIFTEIFTILYSESQGGSKKKSLDKYTLAELKEKAKKRSIKVSGLTKKEIIAKLRKK